MKKVALKNGGYALVDDEDFERVMALGDRWYYRVGGNSKYNVGYVSISVKIGGRNCRVYLHRLVMQPTELQRVDHINHDTRDNRKCNLRIVTNSENNANRRRVRTNRSGLPPGVKLNGKKYLVRIQKNRKRITIGKFNSADEAHSAYMRAALAIWGEFHYEANKWIRQEAKQ